MGKYKKNKYKKTKGVPKIKALKHKASIFPEYRIASKTLRSVIRSHVPLTSVLDTTKQEDRLAYRLASLAIKYHYEANHLMTQLKIYEKNRNLNPWQIKTLMTEMIWGRQSLKSNVLIVEVMRYYEESMRESCLEMTTAFPGCLDSVIPILPTYVRVNTLRLTVDDAIQNFYQEGWKLLPPCDTYSKYLHVVESLDKTQRYFMVDFHIPELLVFPPGISFYKHRGYLTGKLLLQDKGSCLSSYLLNPKPGSTVLDLCAAPGLKTNHLANIMNNNGLLYANDVHDKRFTDLRKLLDLTNVKCAKLAMDNLFNMQVPQEPKLDYILIDPSCTYSGIFSKAEKVHQAERIKRFEWSLSAILRFTLQSFPDVRRVVYTTCSIFPDEGEKVVDDALKEIGDSFTLVDLKELLGKEWVNRGLPKFEMNGRQIQYECGSKCLRTVPEYDLCQGYFIAMFDRNFEVPIPPYVRRAFNKNHSELTEEEDYEDESVT